MPNFASMEMISEPEVIYVPYRKHSSGDLQSRLKTRKILGVGETDNGDVHRSKISQVLGHNEHLYVRLPRCYWAWHLGLALCFTIAGITHLLGPRSDTGSHPMHMMTSFYGSVLLGFGAVLWGFFGTTDKSLARTLMIAVVVAMLAQLLALSSFAYQNSIWDQQSQTDIYIRVFLLGGSGYFFWAMGGRGGKQGGNSHARDDSPTSPQEHAKKME